MKMDKKQLLALTEKLNEPLMVQTVPMESGAPSPLAHLLAGKAFFEMESRPVSSLAVPERPKLH